MQWKSFLSLPAKTVPRFLQACAKRFVLLHFCVLPLISISPSSVPVRPFYQPDVVYSRYHAETSFSSERKALALWLVISDSKSVFCYMKERLPNLSLWVHTLALLSFGVTKGSVGMGSRNYEYFCAGGMMGECLGICQGCMLPVKSLFSVV